MEMNAFIGIICGITGALVTTLTLRRNINKDIAMSGKNEGIILTEIGYVKSGIDAIQHTQTQMTIQHIELASRITAVEASSKRANERIDELYERGFVNK